LPSEPIVAEPALEAKETRAVMLRRLVVFGPVVFIAVGFAGFLIADGFLTYPPALAKPIIVAVEAALAGPATKPSSHCSSGPCHSAGKTITAPPYKQRESKDTPVARSPPKCTAENTRNAHKKNVGATNQRATTAAAKAM
jgi:hypothetical protein